MSRLPNALADRAQRPNRRIAPEVSRRSENTQTVSVAGDGLRVGKEYSQSRSGSIRLHLTT